MSYAASIINRHVAFFLHVDCDRDSAGKTSLGRHRSQTQRYYELRKKYSGMQGFQ